MIATITGEVVLTNMTAAERETITRHFTLPNPMLPKLRRLGLPTWNTPAKISLYSKRDGAIVLPRGSIRWLMHTFSGCETRNKTVSGADVQYQCPGMQLYDYQQEAVDTMLRQRQGIVVMSCGSGKTETALGAIAAIGKPALWLTHSKSLIHQSMERAKSRLGLEGEQLGIIGDGSSTVGTHITYGMVQSLHGKDLSEIRDIFGVLVVDECHHVFKSPDSVAMFEEVIGKIPARYRFGLTATPHRSDGLEETIPMVLGETLYTRDRPAGDVTPIVKVVKTEFSWEDPGALHLDYNTLLEAMTTDASRNRQLSEIIRRQSGSVLVLGSRLAQLRSIRDGIGDPASRYVDGKTNAKEREAALEDMRQGTARVLYASYSLAREGLDIPRLDTLVMATPQKDSAVVQQAVGRVLRKAEGKIAATIFDLLDGNVGVCKGHFQQRQRIYKKINATVEYGG